MQVHGEAVLACIEFGDYGTHSSCIITASQDRVVHLVDIVAGAPITSFVGHTDLISCLEKVDYGRVASGSFDNTVRVITMVDDPKTDEAAPDLMPSRGNSLSTLPSRGNSLSK